MAVFFLLLTVTHAWSGGTADQSSDAQTDVTLATGEAVSDAEDDTWTE